MIQVQETLGLIGSAASVIVAWRAGSGAALSISPFERGRWVSRRARRLWQKVAGTWQGGVYCIGPRELLWQRYLDSPVSAIHVSQPLGVLAAREILRIGRGATPEITGEVATNQSPVAERVDQHRRVRVRSAGIMFPDISTIEIPGKLKNRFHRRAGVGQPTRHQGGLMLTVKLLELFEPLACARTLVGQQKHGLDLAFGDRRPGRQNEPSLPKYPGPIQPNIGLPGFLKDRGPPAPSFSLPQYFRRWIPILPLRPGKSPPNRVLRLASRDPRLGRITAGRPAGGRTEPEQELAHGPTGDPFQLSLWPDPPLDPCAPCHPSPTRCCIGSSEGEGPRPYVRKLAGERFRPQENDLSKNVFVYRVRLPFNRWRAAGASG